MAEAFPRPSWRIRRTIIVATLIFCAAEIAYLTIWGKDTRLSETIANGQVILAGSVIGAYVFGAVWDDRCHDQQISAVLFSDGAQIDRGVAPAVEAVNAQAGDVVQKIPDCAYGPHTHPNTQTPTITTIEPPMIHSRGLRRVVHGFQHV